MEALISYSLDLIVHLVDTTTGDPVTEHQVMFYHDSRLVTYVRKGDGLYVGMNMGKKDRELTVRVKGYLEAVTELCYEKLSGRYPEIFINLIPEMPAYGYVDLLELKGNLAGISSIDAVSMTDPHAMVQGYLEKKQQLKLLQSKKLTERDYALIHDSPESFEEFHIQPVNHKQYLRLREPLQTVCKPEETVTRIIRGRTTGSGDYILRVRGDGRGTDYLVRYVVKGQTKFKRIVFDDPEHRRL